MSSEFGDPKMIVGPVEMGLEDAEELSRYIEETYSPDGPMALFNWHLSARMRKAAQEEAARSEKTLKI